MKKKKGLHDEIARVAHEFYETRDRAHGHDLDDWLVAEKIAMGKHEGHQKKQGRKLILSRKERRTFQSLLKKEAVGM